MADLPGMIGPYQVLKRLGTGGMGEVFLAYDERLDRQVAIKQIRSDAVSTPERRERFRREARMAAKLNHPAIVQIYDVMSEGDGSFIVMEHVEGTNLRQLLDDGPLPVEEVVALARDVAEGLAEAHRHGIVHRDLKSENVLVTPEGRAKIADFGIAKRVLAGTEEDSLTREGRVLGTYRIMSPEQARGEAVDFRSDLFSLGVLLYEALTGQSPFEAENELAMLSRIVRDRQTPVREMRPEVPQRLSVLVDQLLEKDSLLRPRSAGEVAGILASIHGTSPAEATETNLPQTVIETPGHLVSAPLATGAPSDSSLGTRLRIPTLAWTLLILLLGAGAISYLALRSREEPLDVAVLPPQVSGTGEDFELVASGVRSALMRGLLSLERIAPKNAAELVPLKGSPTQIARAVAADEVIRSTLTCHPGACRVSLDRIRGNDGTVISATEFEIPTDDFFLTASAVSSQIRSAYPDHKLRSGDPDLAVDSGDLKEFLQLRQRFETHRDLDLHQLAGELAAIRARAPRFLEVYLLEADIARRIFSNSRDPEDLDRAFSLVQAARKLAPGNPQPVLAEIDLALEAQRLAEAETALDELRRLIPGDGVILDREAFLLARQGKVQEAITVLRSAVKRRPSWQRLIALARLEQQTGQIAAAREHLKQLLDRTPDHFEALSLLAKIELVNGSAERAAEIYRGLASRTSGVVEISNLGLAYFLLGRYGEAAESFQILTSREPKNAFFTLNLADSYLLMGREPEAKALYQKVLDLIAADPTASSPQFLTVKGQALAHLGRTVEAVEAVQEASRLAPNDSGVAYETSLVYVLVGERASALVSARKALKLGYEPRWFTFPWFDPLRPEIQRLVGASSG